MSQRIGPNPRSDIVLMLCAVAGAEVHQCFWEGFFRNCASINGGGSQNSAETVHALRLKRRPKHEQRLIIKEIGI